MNDMDKIYSRAMRRYKREIFKAAWNAAVEAAALKVDDYDSYYSSQSAGDEVRELLK